MITTIDTRIKDLLGNLEHQIEECQSVRLSSEGEDGASEEPLIRTRITLARELLSMSTSPLSREDLTAILRRDLKRADDLAALTLPHLFDDEYMATHEDEADHCEEELSVLYARAALVAELLDLPQGGIEGVELITHAYYTETLDQATSGLYPAIHAWLCGTYPIKEILPVLYWWSKTGQYWAESLEPAWEAFDPTISTFFEVFMTDEMTISAKLQHWVGWLWAFWEGRHEGMEATKRGQAYSQEVVSIRARQLKIQNQSAFDSGFRFGLERSQRKQKRASHSH